jgi:hypothetical protein
MLTTAVAGVLLVAGQLYMKYSGKQALVSPPAHFATVRYFYNFRSLSRRAREPQWHVVLPGLAYLWPEKTPRR